MSRLVAAVLLCCATVAVALHSGEPSVQNIEDVSRVLVPGDVTVVALKAHESVTFKLACPADDAPRAAVISFPGVAGHVTAFVATETVPTATSHLWQALASAVKPLIIAQNDPNWPEAGVFYLSLVSGNHHSKASIVLSCVTEDMSDSVFLMKNAHDTELIEAHKSNPDNQLTQLGGPRDITQLANGIAKFNSLFRGQIAYYSFNVSTAGCNLTLSVTPLFGDPDLYVSTTNQNPNPNDPSTYQNKSRHSGFDQLVFVNAPLANYYIGVYAFTLFTHYSVVALCTCPSAPSFVTLNDGEPQAGNADRASYALFQFSMPAGADTLEVRVTARSGDPDVYIRRDGQIPTTSNFQWASRSWGADLITITASDPNFCNNCVYNIAIFGFVASTFDLTATSSVATTTLQDGVPVQGTAAASMYTYFMLTWPRNETANSTLSIAVTPLEGDPDVYIACSPHPSRDSYLWKGERWLSDIVVIASSDANLCPNDLYYIAVYAANNEVTSFTITASFDEPTELAEGTPVSGELSQLEQSFYVFTPSGSVATISLLPVEGRVNLYVSCNQIPVATNDSSYQASVLWYRGARPLTFDLSNYTACAGQSTLFVSVVGITAGNNSFALTATSAQSGRTRLEDGVPYVAQVDARKWTYFSFYNPQASGQANLMITLTRITGDPDLFVCYPASTRPHDLCNDTNYDAQSRKFGSDQVSVAAADTGLYTIGVVGFVASRFTLLATLQGITPNPVDLSDGIAQAGLVHRGQYAYYQYDRDHLSGDLHITVTAIGSVSLFVSTVGLPSYLNYQWSGVSEIVIPDAPVNTYYIAVYGFADATFSITATDRGSAQVTLTEGIPYADFIAPASNYSYYDFFLDDPTQTVVFTVTPLNHCDPDLYISTDPFANTSNHKWVANSPSGDVITIAPGSPNACTTACTYYVGVLCFTGNCSFTVTAAYSSAQNDTAIVLVVGVPQFGIVGGDAGTHNYYIFNSLPFSTSDLKLSFLPSSGVGLSAYVSANTLPTESSHTWSEVATTPNAAVLLIPHSDPNRCYGPNCTYFIGLVATNNVATNFTLTAQLR